MEDVFRWKYLLIYKMQYISQDSDGKNMSFIFELDKKNLEGVMVYETSDQSWMLVPYMSIKKLTDKGQHLISP